MDSAGRVGILILTPPPYVRFPTRESMKNKSDSPGQLSQRKRKVFMIPRGHLRKTFRGSSSISEGSWHCTASSMSIVFMSAFWLERRTLTRILPINSPVSLHLHFFCCHRN